MKHPRRKRVGIVRVARGPSALDCLQLFQSRCEDFTQLLEILQRAAQIVQFVHQIDLGEESDALVAEFGGVGQPLAQDAMPCRGRLIHAAARTPLRGRFTAAQQALALQALQRRINLAEFCGPEVVDALAEDGFQVVAAGGLAQQAQQNVVQAHERNYITVYINVNCYRPRPAGSFSGSTVAQETPARGWRCKPPRVFPRRGPPRRTMPGADAWLCFHNPSRRPYQHSACGVRRLAAAVCRPGLPGRAAILSHLQ